MVVIVDAFIVETFVRFTFNVLILEENEFNVEIIMVDVFILLAFNICVVAVLANNEETVILIIFNVLNKIKVFDVMDEVVRDER